MEAAVTPISPPLKSFSPLDGARLGAVETVRPEQVQAVVDDVASVQPFWAQLPLHDRARYMRRAGQAIIDQLDDLAVLLALGSIGMRKVPALFKDNAETSTQAWATRVQAGQA